VEHSGFLAVTPIWRWQLFWCAARFWPIFGRKKKRTLILSMRNISNPKRRKLTAAITKILEAEVAKSSMFGHLSEHAQKTSQLQAAEKHPTGQNSNFPTNNT
jgi:hypothetical protein